MPKALAEGVPHRVPLVTRMRVARDSRADARGAGARVLALTLWPSRSYALGRRTALTWDTFVSRYIASPEPSARKETVAGFSLATFDGDRRALDHVDRAYALTLDFDDGATNLDEAAKLFPSTKGVVYTTYSSTLKTPKLRLVLLFSRPVGAEEYTRLWAWAERRCVKRKHPIDTSARDASRFWYLPSHPIGCSTYTWRELSGRALDVEGLLRGPAVAVVAVAKKAPKDRGREGRQEVGGRRGPPAQTSFFGKAFELAGMGLRSHRNGTLSVVCPWADQHTSGFEGDTSTVILPPTTEASWGLFKCSHAHCAKRGTLDLLDALPAPALEAARVDHGAGLVRARVVRGYQEHFDEMAGRAALDRLSLWCVPVGFVARGGFRMTVKLGSEMHRALGSLSLKALIERRVDVAIRGTEITWARLSPIMSVQRRAAGVMVQR